MGNPTCPKCGSIMQSKGNTVKFWRCKNKSTRHGTVQFKRGAQVIPRIPEKTEPKKQNKKAV